MENTPKIRLSHSTCSIERSIAFYRDGLGFEILDRYDEQDGWNGVIFGHRGWPYQIEVSQRRNEEEPHRSGSTTTFVVFCIPEDDLWQQRLSALYAAGFMQVPPPALYKDGCACYEDPDGYRVVLRKGRWKK
ncbi:MAG: VOC family protein [Duodenibacillus sp.]|nr:VOC family protein [Duodenibacillus sp.]